MLIIFLGSPGTGKGTVSNYLKDKLGYIHISSGDIFRSHIKQKTNLGLEVDELIGNGILVDDELTFTIIKTELDNIDLKKKNVILDGFPRNLNQAKILDDYLIKKGNGIDMVINLQLDKKIVVDRLSSRYYCPVCNKTYNSKLDNTKGISQFLCEKDNIELIQREDDKPKNILTRLKIYEKVTKPLIGHYTERNIIKNLNTNKKLEDIQMEILDIIKVI